MVENGQFSKLGFSLTVWQLLLALAVLHKRKCFLKEYTCVCFPLIECLIIIMPSKNFIWILSFNPHISPRIDYYHHHHNLCLTDEETKLQRGCIICQTRRRDRTRDNLVSEPIFYSLLITIFDSLSWSSVLKLKETVSSIKSGNINLTA